jgi:hypothetical protein
MFNVNLPIDVVVQNDCVTETKVPVARQVMLHRPASDDSWTRPG